MSKYNKKSEAASNHTSSALLPQYSPDELPPRYDQAMGADTTLDGTVSVRPIQKEKKEKKEFDTHSLASTMLTDNFVLSSTLLPDASFVPGRTLIIQAKGIRVLRLPTPSPEFEISIFNPDGSIAYTSKRPRVCKGDCVLSSGTGEELVSTEYFFGPSQSPIVRMVSSGVNSTEPILAVSPGWFTRAVEFKHIPSNKYFAWSYTSVKAVEGDKAQVLALRTFDASATKREVRHSGKMLAQLIRSNATRTPGTKKTFAGNGGKLVIAQDAPQYLSEELIVATCMLMLKREIDLRRTRQFACLMAGIGLL